MCVGRLLRNVCLFAAIGLLSSTAWAIEVGLTFQAHQDIDNPDLWPNDFHVAGQICSMSYPPVLLAHMDGPFTGFDFTLVPTGEPCWYSFEANWYLPKGKYIPFCDVIQLGVLFEVDVKNVIINVKAWWTRDGVPVGELSKGLGNDGFAPVLGFDVQDYGDPQVITLANGLVPGVTAETPFAGPGPSAPLTIDIVQLDMVVFDADHAPDFKALQAGTEQDNWAWVGAETADGKPVSRDNPIVLEPNSSVDVVVSTDKMRIPPGGYLVSRQLAGFVNNKGEYETKWSWEIHGSQPAEACCFADGTCQMLQPFTCLEQGGTPQGAGTDCTMRCQVVSEPGACCYDGGLKCEVVDYLKCRDGYLGTWKGAGSDCDDADGDGVADVCEFVSTPPEACCMWDGSCKVMAVKDCLAEGGKPQGAGSLCVGDWDGDRIDETCEAKWVQPPNLDRTGVDVKDTAPVVLADDFLCTETNAITRIFVWGSWLRDVVPGDPANVEFNLAIYDDVPDPDGSGPAYSMPGKALWKYTFRPGTYSVKPYKEGIQEGCWDPIRGTYVFPGDTVCWLYVFDIPAKDAFCQVGTPDRPRVYWLSVHGTVISPTPVVTVFGWKTTARHWNDDGVYLDMTGTRPWRELRYPAGHPWAKRSADLAFALETEPCPASPTEVSAE